VLLEQRPARGVWGGLWGFPEYATRAAALNAARERTGRLDPGLRALAPLRHGFTHFELMIEPYVVELGRRRRFVEAHGETWYNSRTPVPLGLAAPVTALVAGLAARPRNGRP
jgi:A/G-specific adenine glycosylase